jgi:beta-galactosidase/beta-glucuronidase
MKRDSYVNLNGIWDFAVSETTPTAFDRTIRVPFCTESSLSGVKEHFSEGIGLWYRRSFTLPEGFNRGRVLLHIGAADQELTCYVNQKQVGTHAGIDAMTFDITDALQETNELLIRVTDDLRNTAHPYGKQTLKRGGMWYTPVSGIWQTVWLESVPESYIRNLRIDNHGYAVTIDTGDTSLTGTVTVKDLGSFALKDGKVTIAPENPHLWSPEDPFLYEFTVETPTDRVESYFAIRSLEIKTVDGTPRLCLNGKPYFFHGLLDQGYWPDGIYTPASPEAYTWDIQTMKNLGFNTLRKHIKVEPEEFYYQCDRLGMVVFQDMVNNGDYAYIRDTILPTLGWQVWPDKGFHKDKESRAAFLSAMEATVNQLRSHPSICYWTIFNEGWGQFDSAGAYEKLKKLDSTRFIDSTSGWWRGKVTDVDSRHIYFGQWWQLKKGPKPLVLSECGGLTYPVENHIFNPDNSYGYKTCKTLPEFQAGLLALYEKALIPAIREKGLCCTIYTQVSDVEDEINGLVTYDRRIVKADPTAMQNLAKKLREAITPSEVLR